MDDMDFIYLSSYRFDRSALHSWKIHAIELCFISVSVTGPMCLIFGIGTRGPFRICLEITVSNEVFFLITANIIHKRLILHIRSESPTRSFVVSDCVDNLFIKDPAAKHLVIYYIHIYILLV